MGDLLLLGEENFEGGPVAPFVTLVVHVTMQDQLLKADVFCSWFVGSQTRFDDTLILVHKTLHIL